MHPQFVLNILHNAFKYIYNKNIHLANTKQHEYV